jgi:hypothetical protein
MVSVCSTRLAICFEMLDERNLHEVARTRRVWTLHERRCLVGADETPVVERVNAAGRPAAFVGTAFKRYFHIRTGDHGHSPPPLAQQILAQRLPAPLVQRVDWERPPRAARERLGPPHRQQDRRRRDRLSGRPRPRLPRAEAWEWGLTARDYASYAIGLDMAARFQADGTTVNIDQLIQGMKDGFAGAKPRYSEQQLRAAAEAFDKEMQARAQERFKQVSEKNKQDAAAF